MEIRGRGRGPAVEVALGGARRVPSVLVAADVDLATHRPQRAVPRQPAPWSERDPRRSFAFGCKFFFTFINPPLPTWPACVGPWPGSATGY